jgi:hypothetical protein
MGFKKSTRLESISSQIYLLRSLPQRGRVREGEMAYEFNRTPLPASPRWGEELS